MKKVLAAVLAASMAISLTACGGSSGSSGTQAPAAPAQNEAAAGGGDGAAEASGSYPEYN